MATADHLDSAVDPGARRAVIRRSTAVRLAEPSDVDGMIALRADRTWRADAPSTAPGGFLLGSSRSEYREHVAHDRVMVSPAANGRLDAFSVVLDDGAFRASRLWNLRHRADVPADLMARFGDARLAYFDQLVARPGRPWASVRLAFNHLVVAIRRHDAMLATTVVEPVVNAAALPFLRAFGFEVVGHVDETYPGTGRLRSALHLLTRDAFECRMAQPDVRRFAARVAVSASAGPAIKVTDYQR